MCLFWPDKWIFCITEVNEKIPQSPINFFQSSLQPTLMYRRMCRYVGPVVFLAVLLNITKFFEAYVVHNDDGKILLRVSSIRKDPLYSAISKWIRLFILGIFPFCIILYLNFKVYIKLSQRSKNHGSSFQNARIPDTNDIQVCTLPVLCFFKDICHTHNFCK